MRNWISFIAACCICTCSYVTPVIAQEKTDKYLLYNCSIINVLDGSIKKEKAILIEGQLISKIGSFKELKSKVPKAYQIDCKNKYVIPGLWDMHVHLEGTDLIPDNKALLPVFIAYGITTIRDCASDLGEQVLQWRDDINHGKLLGPTIFTAGRKLEGKNSIWKDDLEIENEEELELMLQKLDDYHVDFVKITENTLSGELFLKSVIAANKRGYRTSGHVPIDLTIDELARAGFTSIEHASYLLRLGSDEQKIKQNLLDNRISKAEASRLYDVGFDQQKAIDGYQALGKMGLFVCPTLIGGRQLAFLDKDNHQNDAFLNYLTERFTSKYAWRIGRMANDTEEQRQARKDRYQLICKQLPYLQQAGIKMIAGSDAAALNTYVYPAASLIEELEIFQESGLAPIEILQSATINGALYFGKENERATIDEGKVADLVILDSNPLDNIKAIESIHSVVARGHYFNRAALDEMLKQAIQAKKDLDQERRE